METDYISRNEAINRLQEIANDYEDARDMDAFYVADYCLKHIMELRPAADVRPVKEGRWIKARVSWCTPGGDPVWECSECGKGVHVYGIEHGTYGSDIADGQWVSCPNCGAMMGGTP